MGYRYAIERADYSDLASGWVLRSAPGRPGFPVRLADELFRRALAHLGREPVGVWDPCCGSGYLLTVLVLLHRDRITHVHASDSDPEAVHLAARNLELLTAAGLAQRSREARERAEAFGKPGYLDMAASADRLARRLHTLGGDLAATTCRGDVFAPEAPRSSTDVVLTDVPYGDLTHWSGMVPNGEPVPALLRAVAEPLSDDALLVVTARTRKIPLPTGVRPLERVRVGSRSAVLVRVAEVRDAP
ncbi:rRNA methyltransferase [Salinactinospora qingdaonensis]|uniref:rRNA methyltransferase AviRa n=1 Tax=Salinactinospora qingdaonensis TaxID=702744 RepID=A0ABP7GDV6_9ACTN